MSLIYITGPTGSGKSTICERLNEMGYETYDTDKEGVRFWLDQKSGEPIKTFKKDELHDKDWMQEYVLGLPNSWLEKLKAKSSNKNIFVCGTSPIDHSESKAFDKVVVLTIDEETLRERIKKRTNNDYGKNPEQLEKAVKWRGATIERYKRAGAHEIDGKLPTGEIVEKILSISREL